MLHALAIENYRSCKDLVIPLGRLTLITGPNGVGKSNVYRALRLLADVARGESIASLAREGGLSSVQWAGPEEISRRMKTGEVPIEGTVRKRPVAVRVGFVADELGYAVDFGFPVPSGSAFGLDPEIKQEAIWYGDTWSERRTLVSRKRNVIRARDGTGKWVLVTDQADTRESLLSAVADARHTPEAYAAREIVRSWRFYDQFRTDRDAPARTRSVGTFTPSLAQDGRDLASALQTIMEVGQAEALAEAVDDAFPGTHVRVTSDGSRFGVQWRQPGLLRPLDETELSDGTLRYLLWIAALFTPRPPSLIVLNEPETSLHPDLLLPFARLIAGASERTQVWVVSHAPPLIEALRADSGCRAYELYRELGATQLRATGQDEAPYSAWSWPKR